MPQYYFTLPTSITLPSDGNKVALTTACELHRDDSAVPNALTVAAGDYNVFFASDVDTATATSVTFPTYIDMDDSGASGSFSTWTFTGIDFGVADTNRQIIVAVAYFTLGGSRSISSATIGGVSATIVGESTEQSALRTAFLRATVPTGTSGDVVINWTFSVADAGIIVYRAVGLTTFGSPISASGLATTLNLNLSTTGGCALACAVQLNVDGTLNWTNITESASQDIRTGEVMAAAINASPGTGTLAITVDAETAIAFEVS